MSLESFMVNEYQVKQLVIDRNKAPERANKSLLYISGTLLIVIATLVFWLNAPANAISDSMSEVDSQSIRTKPTPEDFIPKALSPEYAASNSQAEIEKEQSLSNSVLDASGHVVARRIATVSSRVTGKLEKLNIEEGIEVKKHQVLAELDDRQAKISYQLALADLAAQQASYDEMLILQKYAVQKLDRREQLAKEKLISTQLNEDSQLRAEQISAQLKNRQAMVDLAKQRAELALYQLEQHKIRAPFDGVVISKNAQVGELISAGGNGGGTIRTGVGTLVDMNSLEVEVEVGESYINRVKAGQSVFSTLDAYPQWKIASEVIAVIPTADRQKASIKVRIRLLEIDHRVLPDMGVKVSFMSEQITAAL